MRASPHTAVPPSFPAGEQLLTIDQVAAVLRISRTGVKRLRAGGKLPSVTVGERAARWPQKVVLDYLRAISK